MDPTPASGSIVQQNFGINYLPNSVNFITTIAQPVIGTTITLSGGSNPPILSGDDFEDQPISGVLTSKRVKITTVPTNSELYYNGILVIAGQSITNFDPTKLQVKMTAATLNVLFTSFTYSYVDAAGMTNTPATYTLQWGPPLPITIVSFTAQVNRANEVANLVWITTNELNVAKFIVERSTNGTNFSAIGSVVSNTISNSYTYKYIDKFLGVNASYIYYRITAIDVDGTQKMSDIVKVSVKDAASKMLVVVGSPVVNDLNLVMTTNATGVSDINILSADGSMLMQTKKQLVTGANKILLAGFAQKLPKGFYVVRAVIDGQLVTAEFVK